MSRASENALRSAMAMQNAGNLEGAFDQYQVALQSLFQDHRNEPDPAKKEVIQSIILVYMEAAEEVKKTMQQMQQPALRQPSPSAVPLTPPPPISPKPTAAAAIPNPSTASAQPPPAPTAASASATARPDFHDYSRIPPQTKTATVRGTPTTATGAAGARVRVNPAHSVPAAAARAIQGAKSTGNKAAAGRGATTTPAKVTEDKNTEYEQQILSEMLDSSPGVTWDDIAGLSYAKQTLQEAVILPNLRPDLFTGLRAPPKGVLLFGPPGTGKTLLAKAVATESQFSFFCISASSVTSKYLGEGEKLMRGLFTVARKKEPSVIFFDEIDAIMSARKENEHEASRRVKTEFMTQVDGASTGCEERLLIMAATNIPWELDEAVLRRMVKRIYVPLPDAEARRALVSHLIDKHHRLSGKSTSATNVQANDAAPPSPAVGASAVVDSASAASMTPSQLSAFQQLQNILSGNPKTLAPSKPPSKPVRTLSQRLVPVDDNDVGEIGERQLNRIVELTEGYSGSDLNALCHEAAMGPIRELGMAALRTVRPEDVRCLALKDFTSAICTIRPSVSPESLLQYQRWAEQFGVTK